MAEGPPHGVRCQSPTVASSSQGSCTGKMCPKSIWLRNQQSLHSGWLSTMGNENSAVKECEQISHVLSPSSEFERSPSQTHLLILEKLSGEAGGTQKLPGDGDIGETHFGSSFYCRDNDTVKHHLETSPSSQYISIRGLSTHQLARPTSLFSVTHTHSFTRTQPRLPTDQSIPALQAHDLLAHIASHVCICLPNSAGSQLSHKARSHSQWGRVPTYPVHTQQSVPAQLKGQEAHKAIYTRAYSSDDQRGYSWAHGTASTKGHISWMEKYN